MTINKLPNVAFSVTNSIDIFHTEAQLIKANSLEQKCYALAYHLFSAVIIPVGIARVFIHLISRVIPIRFLPSLNIYNLKNKLAQFEKNPTETLYDDIEYLKHLHKSRDDFIANKSNNALQVTLKTADKVEIDACTISSMNQLGTAPADQKWIIYFHGNTGCYERQLTELKLIAAKTGANVLTANYRGVMRSEGFPTSSHDLILDGEAQVQYLLSLGVDTKNILLHGWSLGGAVATEVAAKHQIKDHEMHLCNERSFSDIPELLKAHTNYFFGSILGKIVTVNGWKFDIVKNFQEIKGQKWIIYSKEDGIIRYSASLYKGLKEQLMTTEDRNIKNLRRKAKKDSKEPAKKSYAQFYKPKNTHCLSYADRKLRDGVVKKHGEGIHCSPISATAEIFDRYVLQVKDALKIKNTKHPSYFNSVKSYLYGQWIK